MTARAEVARLYEFHHWATDRIMDAAAGLTANHLDAPWGGSFSTGRALLTHVCGAEWVWLQRWRGESPGAIPFYGAEWSGRDFRDQWRSTRDGEREFVSGLSEAMLAAELGYTNLKGERWSYPLIEILRHVVNHGTYHRGQITHLLRDRGLAAPATDYLIFVKD